MPTSVELEDFFPVPNPTALSTLSPRMWVGPTPESTAAAREILKDSHQKWHLFFLKDYRPHNHSIHAILALWAMGADVEILSEAYKHDTEIQIPKYPSPDKITNENFNDHLGDQDYFDAYLGYFSEVVRTKGVIATLQEHIFDVKANFLPRKEADNQPEMLNRAMDGIIHSVIHFGYGLEFGLPGLVAEGCAWTAVHFASSSKVMPSSLWEASTTKKGTSSISNVESLTQKFLGLGRKWSPSTTTSSSIGTGTTTNTHALTIIARILKDPLFDKMEPKEHYEEIYSNAIDRFGDSIVKHIGAWTYDRSAPGEVERKIEEIVWAITVIYACGGWGTGQDVFNADFFHVHFVTSSIFLPSVAAILTPANQEIFLRSYFAVCLTWWIGHGRAKFDIPAFYGGTSTFQSSSLSASTLTPPHKDALPNPTSYKASTPNPWLPIIRDALVLADDHMPKTIRALAHWGEVLGRTSPRSFTQNQRQNNGKEVIELDGAEQLDGTLFVRAAVLTMERLDKDRKVNINDTNYWDRKGFYQSGTVRREFVLPQT